MSERVVDRDLLAADLLHQHCDRKRATNCQGTLTVKKGSVCAECPLCGDLSDDLEASTEQVQLAMDLCNILDVDYQQLPKEKRLLFLHVLAIPD